MPRCQLHRLRAVFMRGGTSKALMFRAGTCPPTGRSGTRSSSPRWARPIPTAGSSTAWAAGCPRSSKVCVSARRAGPMPMSITPSSRSRCDEALVDYGGNCGNMSSAIGPFAVEEGLVPAPPRWRGGRCASTTPTPARSSSPASRSRMARWRPTAISSSTASPAPPRRSSWSFSIRAAPRPASCCRPAAPIDHARSRGARHDRGVLRRCRQPLRVRRRRRASARPAPNCPTTLERDAAFLEAHGSDPPRRRRCAWGWPPTSPPPARIASIPKVAMVCAPAAAPTLSGRRARGRQRSISRVRMISVGQPHRAVPITGAICLAVAARVPGTIPHRLCAAGDRPDPHRPCLRARSWSMPR